MPLLPNSLRRFQQIDKLSLALALATKIIKVHTEDKKVKKIHFQIFLFYSDVLFLKKYK